MEKRRVVITGLGMVSPLGSDLNVFWQRLIEGASGIRRITKFDASAMATQIAGEVVDFEIDKFIPKKEQRRMDPFCHYAVAAAKMAVDDSGIQFASEDLYRAGCMVGSGVGGLITMEDQHNVLLTRGPDRSSPFMIPMMIVNMASGLVAIEHGLKGPNFCVVSACASGTHSIGEAARQIQYGDADIMLAGGTEAVVCPLGIAGFSAMRAMSTRNDDPTHASRPFDKDRDGFVMGEGAGIVVLEEYEHAKKRGAKIYAEVGGYGATCDANHITAPSPGGEGGARAMVKAMNEAGLTPDMIDYINAHGTSTPVGDKSETDAVKVAFGEASKKVMVSSTKSVTGHLLGAAGGLETIICALAIQKGVVPPTMNYTTPDPELDLDYVPNQARDFKIRACLNNSLGFGGHNASLLLKRV
ncbi:MAG: beta-ketoacyl-ACP synthase II [bacterium]|jgi:3-oxoacyl-[acyl-carrier-protein] synthase II